MCRYNKKVLLKQYEAISQRIPPAGETMAKLRNSATEYIEAETKDIRRARDLMQASRQTKCVCLCGYYHYLIFPTSFFT